LTGQVERLQPACPLAACDGSGWIVDADDVAHPCQCRQRRIQQARTRGVRATLPRKYEGVGFDRPPISEMARDPKSRAVVGQVRAFVDELDARIASGRGLWLMGDVGTGKTTLAMLVSKLAMQAGYSAAVYSLPKLLTRIRKTYDHDLGAGDLSYAEFFRRLTSVDLLHIDDLGVTKQNDWVLEQLFSIVDERYSTQGSMVVTTDLEPDALEEQIGQRTVSRLVEICGDPLPLFGDDKRYRVAPP
jgi:DNA replication protein DnaC